MAHSEKCPVCEGSGKLPGDTGTTDCTPVTCHGCYGRGWVTVGVEYQPPIYYTTPVYQPYYPYPYWTYTWDIVTDNVTTGTTYQLPEDAQIFYT